MTTPTIRLLLSRRTQLLDWLRRSDPWPALSLLIVLIVVLVGMWPTRPAAPPGVQQVTPAPVILIATSVPAMPIPIVASSAELRLVRAVVAYDAPDGEVLGAIEPGRPYQLVARSGAVWVQLAIDGSGRVWVRRDELEGMMDVATPLSTEQPIVIATEQQRAAPDEVAATAAPRYRLEHPQLPRRPSLAPSCIGTRTGRSWRHTPVSRMGIGGIAIPCTCIPNAASRGRARRSEQLSLYHIEDRR